MEAQEIIFEVHEESDGGYSAPAVGHSIFTQGDDWEELKANIQDAKSLYFQGEREAPTVVRLLLRLSRTLAVA